MAIAARLEWAITCAQEGHAVRIVSGFSDASCRHNVRVRVGSLASVVPFGLRASSVDLLRVVQELVRQPSLKPVDRGHKHSDGHNEFAIWFSLPVSTPVGSAVLQRRGSDQNDGQSGERDEQGADVADPSSSGPKQSGADTSSHNPIPLKKVRFHGGSGDAHMASTVADMGSLLISEVPSPPYEDGDAAAGSAQSSCAFVRRDPCDPDCSSDVSDWSCDGLSLWYEEGPIEKSVAQWCGIDWGALSTAFTKLHVVNSTSDPTAEQEILFGASPH